MQLFGLELSWESRPLSQPWHSILLALFAIPLLAASVWDYKSTADFLRSAQRSTGVVVALIEKGGLYHPRVRYVDAAGREQEFESQLESRPPRFSVGQRLSVLYQPEAPAAARIEDFFVLWWVSLITAIVGLALTIAAVTLWIWREPLFAHALRAQEQRTRGDSAARGRKRR
jgi:hypothetical protein